MYKVGTGETPAVPDHLGTEIKDFISHCLEHDAAQRWTATELLDHSFVKVRCVWGQSLV